MYFDRSAENEVDTLYLFPFFKDERSFFKVKTLSMYSYCRDPFW